MFPAIFAVLLLGHFVAAEIYVGQNPQNVNAVIKDSNGNLVPVTGVADEIVVVDLNYGGQESSSGMSVDVSVSPVNGTSSGSSGYPSLSGFPPSSEYPSSISSPSGADQISNPSLSSSASSISSPSGVGQISNPPLSASPVSLPASSPSTTFGSSGASNPFNFFGSSSQANPPMGTGSSPAAPLFPGSPSLTPPSTSPVSEYDNLVSNMSSGSSGSGSSMSGIPNSNTGASSSPTVPKPPSFGGPLGFFGNGFGKKKPPTPKNGPFTFIELGGDLGPVVESQNGTEIDLLNNTSAMPNSTSSIATVPLTLTSSPLNLTNIFGSLPKLNATFPPAKNTWNSSTPLFNMGSFPMFNMSSVPAFNMSSFPTFNMSSIPMFNASSIPMTSSITDLLNSLFNGSTANLKPLSSSPTPLSGFMNSFINGGPSLFNPMSSNMLPLTNMVNSFMNSFSSPFSTSGSSAPSLINLMNSFMNTSSLFNSSSTMNSLNDMMNSFMNSNPMMPSSTNGSLNPFTDMMNSIFNTTTSMFNLTNNASFTNMMNSLLNGSSTMFNPMGPSGSAFSNLFSPSANGSPFSNMLTLPSGESLPDEELESNLTNGSSPFSNVMNSIFNTTGLKSTLQNILPFNLFGDDSDDDYEDFIPEFSGNDDEDYYNPLSSLLPPRISAGAPSANANPLPGLAAPLGGIQNMVNNLLTPAANGTTPLTSLLDSTFGLNGASPLTSSPFMPGGLLNPFSFMNGSQTLNTSSFANYKPFSNFMNIISSLNSTGLFGDLSGVSGLIQNLSSTVSQAMNNNTKNVNTFGQIMTDLQSMWKDMNSTLHTFMSNVAAKPIPAIPSIIPQPVSQPPVPFPPKISQPPLVNAGLGSSFLAIPSSAPAPLTNNSPPTDDMQSDAPESDTTTSQSETTTPETTTSPTETSTPATNTSSSSTSPQPSTTDQGNSHENGTTTPPTKAPGSTSSSSSGINLSSTWITLVGCVLVAFSQKNFFGLL